MKKYVVAILLVFAGYEGLAQSAASHGGEVRNGGNEVAQDFTTMARQGLQVLKAQAMLFPKLNIVNVENAINSSTVQVLAKGQSLTSGVRTAENVPSQKKIYLNQDRWQKIFDPRQKMALALHEYLGLTGYEVNNYKITSKVFGIADYEMEQTPNMAELKASFIAKKPFYSSLLDKAATMTPAPLPMVKLLTSLECQKLKVEEFEKYYGKNSAIPIPLECYDSGTTVSAAKVNGVNFFGIPYSHVVVTNIKSYLNRTAVFLREGRIIQIQRYFNALDGAIVSTVASMDKKGNIYQLEPHYSSAQIGCSSQKIVLADGTSVEGVSRISCQGKKEYRMEMTDVNFINWDKNEVEINMRPLFFYSTHSFWYPNNYRSLKIDNSGPVQKAWGVYVSNGLEFLIQ